MPLLTVIVPTYNRAALLAEAFVSLQSQECTDFEVIVVDDGSTDDTAAVLTEYERGTLQGKLQVLRQENAGQGAARNLALAAAQGEYCCFLDSDDLFLPWTLAMIAQVIFSNGRPSVILGQESPFQSPEEFNAIRREPLRVTLWPDLYKFTAQHPLGPCGILVARTELLREAGGFATERIVGEDVDMMLRLGIAPNMVKIHAPGMYGYRVHPQNFVKDYEAWYRGACLFIRRYRGGMLPGGAERAAEAQKQAADGIAYYTYYCLHHGGRMASLGLYLRTIGIQLRARNFRYVLNLPISVVRSLAGRFHPWDV